MDDKKVNYIVHLNAVLHRFFEDERATPFHISLYMALFDKWNACKFKSPISVARDEIMEKSKIGSANTYTKCLKELHQWQYINYLPSFNYHIGSKIYLYTFNNRTDNGTNIPTDKTTDKGSAKAMRPYTNGIKQIVNNTNNLNLDDEQAKNNSEFKSGKNPPANAQIGKRKKVAPNKESEAMHRTESGFKRPLLFEVKQYFEQKSWSELEAEKFHNYFESNGWLIGGKTPMKNWQAAANNWILNATKFQKNEINKTSNRAGKLHTSQAKNYGEAL